MLLKTWVERRLLKKYYVIAVIFHDVSESEKYKFARIIKYLHQRFPFLTPTEFEDYLAGKYQLKDTSILVTFDDGFTSSRDVTVEILEPLGIKAAFFCCTNFIGMSEPAARNFVAHNLYLDQRSESDIHLTELPLSREEIKSLSQRGHLIAAHTNSHINLGKDWPSETLEQEIIFSSEKLQNWVAQKIEWFAFPFGGIDFINFSSLQVIQKKFKFCFSGIRGHIDQKSHPMALPRQSITIQDSYLLQLALFYGATNWLHRKKTRRIEAMAEGGAC
jgi:peptidoglycan/xylan/chitin deacetylase (PgdA/CDA1 family)